MHPTRIRATTPDPTPAATLRRAADYLEAHGWIQGQYYASWNDEQPAACTVGALAVAAYGYPHPEPFCDDFEAGDDALIDCWSAFVNAEFALAAYLGLLRVDERRDPDDMESVHTWNDKPARTGPEVIAALRAAADDYEAAS